MIEIDRDLSVPGLVLQLPHLLVLQPLVHPGQLLLHLQYALPQLLVVLPEKRLILRRQRVIDLEAPLALLSHQFIYHVLPALLGRREQHRTELERLGCVPLTGGGGGLPRQGDDGPRGFHSFVHIILGLGLWLVRGAHYGRGLQIVFFDYNVRAVLLLEGVQMPF